MKAEEIDIYNEVDNFVEENEGEVTNTEIARHFFELGRNNAINKACEWLENNLDGYLVIEEDNYEGCVKACYIHSNVYRDFMGAMKGDL